MGRGARSGVEQKERKKIEGGHARVHARVCASLLCHLLCAFDLASRFFDTSSFLDLFLFENTDSNTILLKLEDDRGESRQDATGMATGGRGHTRKEKLR